MEEKRLLTDDELELVSGGHRGEHYEHLSKLAAFGIVSMDDFSSGKIPEDVLTMATKNLRKHGIIAEFYHDRSNDYFIYKNGKKIRISINAVCTILSKERR